jgi:hypothetical protein
MDFNLEKLFLDSRRKHVKILSYNAMIFALNIDLQVLSIKDFRYKL